MGLFGDKPKVSKKEFSEACSGLYSKGFSTPQVNKVKTLFVGDMQEPLESEKDIDATEIAGRVAWMRQNKSIHGFSDKQIDEIERQLKNRL